MPTDRGRSRPRTQNRHSWCAGDRTAEPCTSFSWPAVGVGLHLLSLASPETVAPVTLPGMTLCSKIPTLSEPPAEVFGHPTREISCHPYIGIP